MVTQRQGGEGGSGEKDKNNIPFHKEEKVNVWLDEE